MCHASLILYCPRLSVCGARRAARPGVVGALGAGAPAHRLDAARVRVRCAALSARSDVVGGQSVGVSAGPPRARVRVQCLARVQLCLVCSMRAWALRMSQRIGDGRKTARAVGAELCARTCARTCACHARAMGAELRAPALWRARALP